MRIKISKEAAQIALLYLYTRHNILKIVRVVSLSTGFPLKNLPFFVPISNDICSCQKIRHCHASKSILYVQGVSGPLLNNGKRLDPISPFIQYEGLK